MNPPEKNGATLTVEIVSKGSNDLSTESHIPRSRGCVTVAAKQEADPPNQNG